MTYDAHALASPTLMAPVTTTLDWLVEALAGVVRQGVENGELRDDLDPAALACTIAAVVQGGYVLARAHGDASPFDAAVDGAVGLLERASV